jgi:5-methylcytosine-specific restriction endonuclease McrA
MSAELLHNGQENPWYCPHPASTPRYKIASNGRRMYLRQCLTCGRTAEGGFTRATPELVATATLFDDSIRQQWNKSREEEWRQTRETERRAWWERYDAHLRSPRWRELAAKVRSRARGVCEGCAERPGDHVHHLTYDRLGAEMLFDLVLVCRRCHEAIHPHMRTS